MCFFVELSDVEPQRKPLDYSDTGKILAKEKVFCNGNSVGLVVNTTSI